jgi:predicted flap endonuclease-1-like 5' DNA nuclease
MDFLTQLFTSLGTRDSVLVILFLIVAWLLGYLVKHLQLSSRIDKLETDLRAIRSSHIDTQAESLPFENTSEVSIQADDLKRLEGIGPKIEELLNGAGIHTWKQLSLTSPEVLATILQRAGDRFRIHDPSSWPEQARLLAEGRIEEFENLTDTLTGGRRG